jgi:hypothetical protein
MVVWALWGACLAQSPARSDAVLAVRTTLDVERALLNEDNARYRSLASRRDRAMARLDDLYRSLDAAVRRTDREGAEAVRQTMEQIELAEKDRAAILATERVLIDRIGDRIKKIAMLEERVEALRARSRQVGGQLTGDWSVTLLPIDQKGRFSITQSGTVLNGTYTLDGGWTGSLQGTLVNRKVYMVRIDSKLGRSMEFEGYLAADGKRIRGTWLSYELAGERRANGQWAAERTEGQ